MNPDNEALELLRTAAVVDFRVLDQHVEMAPDGENHSIKVELQLLGDEEAEPEDVVEWAAIPFIYGLAVLSFADARPRGLSEIDYQKHDDFSVSDLVAHLSFGTAGLRLTTDYLRGRSLKTNITMRTDGTLTISTWGRGQALLNWLDRLQGKKPLRLV